MITVEHISKHYGRVAAADDVSFTVKEGENLVLLGTSGCGKTTTLKMINRLIVPTSGSIAINGKDISRQSPEALRRGIGYVLQHNSLFPHYTVAENIAVVPQLLGWDTNKIKSSTEALLARLHLPESCLHVYPHQLSGGQQQRVNIARALAADPPILLMDEPFGALDTITRTAISREFSEIEEFMRKTIVMVTHDVLEAFLIADTICLMNKGRVMQTGKPTDLLFHPANDFVKEFLSAHYLRLAMGAVKLTDVWDELHGHEVAGEPPGAVSAGESVWNVIDHSIRYKEAKLSVTNHDGVTKHISREELFRAISRYHYQ